MLISALLRAKELTNLGVELNCPPALHFFIKNELGKEIFLSDPEVLDNFVLLDDSDIWSALKTWSTHSDFILSTLSYGLINRKLFKIEISEDKFDLEKTSVVKKEIQEKYKLTEKEDEYFVSSGTIENKTYNPYNDSIDLLLPNGNVSNISETSDILSITPLTQKCKKYYFSYLRIG